jgi:hypothetical protein
MPPGRNANKQGVYQPNIRLGLPLWNVSLKIYDLLGKEIKTLVNEHKLIGKYEIIFNASDLASGMYIYRIQTSDYVSTKKMMLLK